MAKPEYLVTVVTEYRTKIKSSNASSALELSKEVELSDWEQVSRTETAELCEE